MGQLLTRSSSNVVDLDPTTGDDNPTNILANSNAIDQVFAGLKTADASNAGVMSASDYSKLKARNLSLTALTGGAAGALDALAVATLTDGDTAMVNVSNVNYEYLFDADGTNAESSPDVNRPDDYATQGVWLLQKSYADDYLEIANNLSDLNDADTALDNLGGATAGKAIFTAESEAAARAAAGIDDTQVDYLLGDGTTFNGLKINKFILSIKNDGGTIKHRVLSPVGYTTTPYAASFAGFSSTYAATPNLDGVTDFESGVGFVSSGVIIVFDQTNTAGGSDIIEAKVLGGSTCFADDPVLPYGQVNSTDVYGTTKNRASIRFYDHAGDGTSWAATTGNIAAGKELLLLVTAITA